LLLKGLGFTHKQVADWIGEQGPNVTKKLQGAVPWTYDDLVIISERVGVADLLNTQPKFLEPTDIRMRACMQALPILSEEERVAIYGMIAALVGTKSGAVRTQMSAVQEILSTTAPLRTERKHRVSHVQAS